MKPVSFANVGADRLKLLACSPLLTLAFAAQAHPGHDLRDASPEHLLTSPDHLAVLALGGAALWLAGWGVPRPLPRRFLQAAGLVAACSAALIWGARV
jgi:hypothetical protein